MIHHLVFHSNISYWGGLVISCLTSDLELDQMCVTMRHHLSLSFSRLTAQRKVKMAEITYVCRRCCRHLNSSRNIRFYMSSCAHLICMECAKKLVVLEKSTPSAVVIKCPVEGDLKRIVALDQNIPRDVQKLFKPKSTVSAYLYR